MDEDYGIAKPGAHHHTPHRKPARYLVMIESGGSGRVARLFTDARVADGEFDASTEEVAEMTQGLTPARSAAGPEWDHALAGHSATERAGAEVYTLDV